MTRIKDATFESGSITGTDGMSSNSGATLDSSSLIKGTYCLRTQWATAVNVNASITGLGSNSELYVSFYYRVATKNTSGTPRLVTASNGSTQWVIDMNSSGVMRIRNNGTSLATILTPALNTTYRIGVYFKPSSADAAADGILRVWVATGDAAFSSTPTYETTTYTMNTTNANISSIGFGQNNASGNTGDHYWDDIRVDNASMPGPSVVITHSVKTGSWRWYSDSATDAGLTALAAENTAPTLTANQLQGLEVLRLRIQLIEKSGGSGSGVVQVRYGGDTSTLADIGDNPLSNTQAGLFAAWGAGAATHLATITTRVLTGSNESGTYRESTSVTAESVGASVTHELDIAIVLRYPPPSSTLYFQISYGGTAIDPDSGKTLPSLTTPSAATRGNTLDKLTTGLNSVQELLRPQYSRLIHDGTNFWAFVPSSSTTLSYYYWDGGTGAWSAASTVTFTGPINTGRMWITYKLVGSAKVVYAYYYRAGDLYSRRGVISGTSITWQAEDGFDNFNLVGTQTAGHHHGVLDGSNKFTFAFLDATNGLGVARSATADDGSGSFFVSMSGVTAASVADPDGALSTSSGAVQVVPLDSDNSLILWQNLGNLKAVRYNGSANTLGSVTTINSCHATDWYAVKQGSYVYILFNSGSGVLAMQAYSIAGNSFAACPSPSMTAVNGDGLTLIPTGTDEVALVANFTGPAGGVDRVIKYKKYTGPGSAGSYGSITQVLSTVSRGRGRNPVGVQVQASRAAFLWEFGEDAITSTPYALEYHTLNAVYSVTITATSTPARTRAKTVAATRSASATSSRSRYKLVTALRRASATSGRALAKIASKVRATTVTPLRSRYKLVTKQPLSRTVTPNRSRAKIVNKSPLQRSVTSSASRYKLATKAITRSVSVVLTLARALVIARRAGVTVQASIQKTTHLAIQLVTILTTSTPVVTMARSIAIARRAIVQGLPSRSKLVAIVRQRSVATTRSIGKSLARTLTFTPSVARSRSKAVSKSRANTVTVTRSRAKVITKYVRRTVNPLLSRAKSLLAPRRATVASAGSRAASVAAIRAGIRVISASRRLNTVKGLRATALSAGNSAAQVFKGVIIAVSAVSFPTIRRSIVKAFGASVAIVGNRRAQIARSVTAVIAVIGFSPRVVTKRLITSITSITARNRLVVINRRATAVISGKRVAALLKYFTGSATSAGATQKQAWAVRRTQATRSGAIRKSVLKRLSLYTISVAGMSRAFTQVVEVSVATARSIRRALLIRRGGTATSAASRQLRASLERRAFALPLPRRIAKIVALQPRTIVAHAFGSVTSLVGKVVFVTAEATGIATMARAIRKFVVATPSAAPRIAKHARRTIGALVVWGAGTRKTIARVIVKPVVIAPQAQRLVTLVRLAIAIVITSRQRAITRLLQATVNPLLSRSRAIVKRVRVQSLPVVTLAKQIAKQPLRAQVQRLARIVFALPSGLGKNIGGAGLAVDRATRKFVASIDRAVRSLRRDT